MDVKLTRKTVAVLGELLRDPGRPRYGLDISQKAELRTTTIYDILMRLERARWVESRWEAVAPDQVGRPRRRLYRLTGTGEEAARTAVESEIERLQRAIEPAKPEAESARVKPRPSTVGATS